MIRAVRGWNRARFAARAAQRRLLAACPVVFACYCTQCYCGGIETAMIAPGIPCCRQCGRPRQARDGRYYGTEHNPCCSKPAEEG